MQLGMIGLGRMGANMVRRLMKDGHECVVFDVNQDAVKELEGEGAHGAASIEELCSKLAAPRNVWMMVPAALVDGVVEQVVPHLQADDTLIDGGNSYYKDDLRRSKELRGKNIHYIDVGVSGGVWGLERGYCHMIGGDDSAVERMKSIFVSLAPGMDCAPRTPHFADNAKGAAQDAEMGFLHCGPCGAGHFVKMVHNGIEYGVMAAYAEGLNILKHANIGKSKVTPLEDATEDYLRSVAPLAPVVEYFTVNVSSPNTPGLRELQQSDALSQLLHAVVPAAEGLPVFVKFSPDLEDAALDQAVEIAIAANCTGIIATNTSRTRPETTGRLEEAGGMSGAPLWPLSRSRIQRILDTAADRIPVIGAGGVCSPEQAQDLLSAGCVAVQLYSGMIFEGPGLIHRINDGLNQEQ